MPTLTSIENQIATFMKQFLQLDQGDIESLLDNKQLHLRVTAAEDKLPYRPRYRIWTLLTTTFAFIRQVLNESTCSDAVKTINVELIENEQKPCSVNTSAYCQARERLPESLLSNLIAYTGERLDAASRNNWSWHGRPVKIADGTTLTMADTPANQAVYPQESNQKEGLGFPILRLEIVTSLNSGGVLGAEIAPYSGKGTGEMTLLRKLQNTCFLSGDIALFDRYYDNFWILDEFHNLGADLLCPMRGGRKIKWQEGVPLKGDYYDRVFELKKPACPAWMSASDYQKIPRTLTVRMFRIYRRIYVTTLMDSRHYRKNALRKLYKQRWKIEIDLKFIKQVMKMEPLSCKAPEMVRKEIRVFLLAYNLIRLLMLQAGIRHHIWPCRISFREALGTFKVFASKLAHAVGSHLLTWIKEALQTIAAKLIDNRPGRVEPRVVKKRPAGNFPYMKESRSEARKKIIAAQNTPKNKGFMSLSRKCAALT